MLTKQFRLGQFRFIVLVLVALVVYAAPARAKSKDDVVVLKNGDRMTGEIKKLQRGELIFKASYMADAVRLDWSKVARLESKDKYLIILTDGRLFTDNLRLSPSGGDAADNFLIGAEKNAFKTEQKEVLRITPVEAGFFRQLEGTMDFGLSFTSGNDQYQTDFSSSVTYRKGIHTLTGRLDSTFSGQTEGSSSARNQFTLDYRRQLSPRWYAGGIFDLLRSDQQSLDRRVTVGGLLGRSLRQTERTRLSVFGGLAGTRDKYSATTGTPKTTNADALAGVDFSTFRFTTTDISSRLLVYPSLTTPGRTRMQFNADLRIKLVKDLYWGFHLYENYDSKPPVSAERNELGASTSLGWKF
jgi:putative salt-induced outer membrane protein YdiY